MQIDYNRQYADKTVWLSFLSYPVTTAVYIERALRQICKTVTVGPTLPEHYIEKWQLQSLKLPFADLEIKTDFNGDMAEVLKSHPDVHRPDLFLWVESAIGYFPKNLAALGCPTCCYLIDSHVTLDHHLTVAAGFDFVFIAQRAYLEKFQEVNPRTFWLPLACDPDVQRRWPCEKQYDLSFVGSVPAASKREALLSKLNAEVPIHLERCFWDDMAKVFSASKIVFNNAVNHDLNMRVFEAMSCGTLLLTDLARKSGQDELFVDGEDYACYHEGNLTETARFYLDNETLRERLAARGQRLVRNAHTYRHRVEDLLAVALHGKPDTFSAAELRERSVVGMPTMYDEVCGSVVVGAPARSFVIPVLDYSPASEYNILTLLDDLQKIDGEVIVVFNGAQVGEELKQHPRITRHAIMKQNVGVARGWNVGLNMAEAETVFIVNADAHIKAAAVTAVEEGLRQLPLAACVGPQGAFVNYRLCCDYVYFDRGSFTAPLEVDAVSGFFFAVNRRLFSEHGIAFENCFTPCYFEEWDLGLQLKRVGLKSYVVPTTAYDHHWSGTIRALRSIHYMGHEDTAEGILSRNREFFLAKWRQIARTTRRPELLDSGWKRYLVQQVRRLLAEGDSQQANDCLRRLQLDYPDDIMVMSLAKFFAAL